MKRWLALLLFYALLLVFHGYTFGSNDHIELMPYVRWLDDQSLYPHDFFMQHLVHRFPNERIVTALLLYIGGKHLEWWTFLLHAVSTLGLLNGLYQIARLFLDKEWKIWFFLFLFFFPLYRFNLGGNDIYYNSLSASNLSKAFGIWAIYSVLSERLYRASGYAILATFFHPVAGLQVFILSFGARLMVFMNKIAASKSNSEKQLVSRYFKAVLLFCSTAGIWVAAVFLKLHTNDVSDDLFFEIIKFRLPHHFIPASFGYKNYILFVILIVGGMIYYFKKNRLLFYFITISVVGLIFYVASVGFYQHTAMISTQWFKTTIWLKPLGLLAILSYVLGHIKDGNWYAKILMKLSPAFVFTIMLVFLSIFQLPEVPIRMDRIYNFPFSNPLNNDSAEKAIAIMAEELTPTDAVFLTPASCTAFKYYSKRSSYIDFKAVTHRKTDFVEWYHRIKEVYGMDASTGNGGFGLLKTADENYNTFDFGNAGKLQQMGVTHILVDKNLMLPFAKVIANGSFSIYQVQ